jgi:hypothetical protein
MGDISTRGKGKTLKMKKGGALPSNKGASKAGMQSKQGRNFLLPKEKEPKRFKQPGKPEPRPIPMPRPKLRPIPMPRPKLRDKRGLEKFMMTPIKKKDGGEMMDLKSLLSKATFSGVGISLEKLKKAFKKAKEIKPTGRINTDDLKKALGMMGKGAGGPLGSSLFKNTEPKIKGRFGGPKTAPKRRTKLRKLI